MNIKKSSRLLKPLSYVSAYYAENNILAEIIRLVAKKRNFFMGHMSGAININVNH